MVKSPGRARSHRVALELSAAGPWVQLQVQRVTRSSLVRVAALARTRRSRVRLALHKSPAHRGARRELRLNPLRAELVVKAQPGSRPPQAGVVRVEVRVLRVRVARPRSQWPAQVAVRWRADQEARRLMHLEKQVGRREHVAATLNPGGSLSVQVKRPTPFVNVTVLKTAGLVSVVRSRGLDPVVCPSAIRSEPRL